MNAGGRDNILAHAGVPRRGHLLRDRAGDGAPASRCPLLCPAMLRRVGCPAMMIRRFTSEQPLDGASGYTSDTLPRTMLCGLHMLVAMQPLTYIASSRSVAHIGGSRSELPWVCTYGICSWRPADQASQCIDGQSRAICCAAAGGAGEGEGGTDRLPRGAPHPFFQWHLHQVRRLHLCVLWSVARQQPWPARLAVHPTI